MGAQFVKNAFTGRLFPFLCCIEVLTLKMFINDLCWLYAQLTWSQTGL